LSGRQQLCAQGVSLNLDLTAELSSAENIGGGGICGWM
jgi:hypothetical protein